MNMKVNFKNKEIDVDIVQEKTNESIAEYTCHFGLYEIDIYKHDDCSDVSVEILVGNDEGFIEELFFSEDDSILDMLQSAFNLISENIDFKRQTISEFWQVLDSVKEYL